MINARQLLQENYLTRLKTDSRLFIGVEFEFPIVSLDKSSTNTNVTKALLYYLGGLEAFTIGKHDQDGHAIELIHSPSQDHIVFEFSYNVIEFAFEKAESIEEIERRFKDYLALIQPWLAERGHALQGKGIHPSWVENDNSPIKTSRYLMLMRYLQLGETLERTDFHHFPDYGGFICGNQVQLDVTADNYLDVLNTFNEVEAVKAYLFANSPFDGADWDTLISRDIFWEQSMHGYYEENVGIFPREFADTEGYLDWLELSSIYTVERDGQIYYFSPIRARDFLAQESVLAYDLDGSRHVIVPRPEDFRWHRAYHYQDLTKRGTVEFRSTCAQPLDQSFVPVAFHLGLMANLNRLKDLLRDEPLFHSFNHDYRAMRRYFSKPRLESHYLKDIHALSQRVLDCAESGLRQRGYGEESYLADLIAKLKSDYLR